MNPLIAGRTSYQSATALRPCDLKESQKTNQARKGQLRTDTLLRNIGARRPRVWLGKNNNKNPTVASYRFSARINSRSQGRSAIAAAAYRAGERLKDYEIGREYGFPATSPAEAFGCRARDARRDRPSTRPQDPQRGSDRRDARHNSRMVPKAGRSKVRWISGTSNPGSTTHRSGSGESE